VSGEASTDALGDGTEARSTVPRARLDVTGGRLRRARASIVGLVAAVVFVMLLRTTGSLRASDDALVVMGFDPERASLITALLTGALAGGVVAAFGGQTAVAVVASVGATAALFWSVFRSETLAALSASGDQGRFDPAGWTLTVVTLVVIAVAAGWGAGTLAAVLRRFAVAAWRQAVDSVQRGRGPAGLAPIGVVLAVIAVLVVTIPVFGDMLNYEPDVHMRAGAPVMGGLGGGPSATEAGGTSSPSAIPAPSVLPAGLGPGPLPGSLMTPGVTSAARPWAASPPSGAGQIVRIHLPAPWTGGVQSTTNVDLYLPPGFGTAGIRYPVVYEAPYGIESWAKGVDIASTLDGLITSGAIPPMIVAFASSYGGPYADVECADAFDGREQFDTYIATSLVPYIDGHYPTIASPTARVVMGASQGGYCAAALWSHHPDVFGAAVSFSGYFTAGVISPETQNAARPFGGNAGYEFQQSPVNVVTGFSSAATRRSFVVLSADLGDAFFGPQVRQFAAALAAARVPMAILPSPLGHSWATQRQQLPRVLELLAGWMTQQGAFGHV